MKTFISIALCLVIFLLGSFCGFLVSNNLNTEPQNDIVKSQSDIAGTYKATDWYDYEAIIVLYDNGTCIYPTRTAYSNSIWGTKDGKFYINGGEDAIIVPQGIIYKNIFFEKI